MVGNSSQRIICPMKKYMIYSKCILSNGESVQVHGEQNTTCCKYPQGTFLWEIVIRVSDMKFLTPLIKI